MRNFIEVFIFTLYIFEGVCLLLKVPFIRGMFRSDVKWVAIRINHIYSKYCYGYCVGFDLGLHLKSACRGNWLSTRDYTHIIRWSVQKNQWLLSLQVAFIQTHYRSLSPDTLAGKYWLLLSNIVTMSKKPMDDWL